MFPILFLYCSLYEIFPYMAPRENTTEYLQLVANPNFVGIEPGKGWSNSKQGSHQAAALGITLGMAIVGGLITGSILWTLLLGIAGKVPVTPLLFFFGYQSNTKRSQDMCGE